MLEIAKIKLDAGEPLRSWYLEGEDEKLLRGFQFLSQQPVLYVMNLGEDDAAKLNEVEASFRE